MCTSRGRGEQGVQDCLKRVDLLDFSTSHRGSRPCLPCTTFFWARVNFLFSNSKSTKRSTIEAALVIPVFESLALATLMHRINHQMSKKSFVDFSVPVMLTAQLYLGMRQPGRICRLLMWRNSKGKVNKRFLPTRWLEICFISGSGGNFYNLVDK